MTIMENPLAIKPKWVNNNHFSTGEFPDVIGFCDRDLTSNTKDAFEESYMYKWRNQIAYVAKKRGSHWEIVTYRDNKPLRATAANSLLEVLMQTLSFYEQDRARQDSRINILFPINPEDRDKALSLMYYLGGYPSGLLPMTAEFALVKEKFIGPQI